MNKRITIQIRISKERKELWKTRAEKEYLTLTDFVISRVEENLTFKLVRDLEKMGDKIINKRSIVGNNINQIARQVNIDKGISDSQLRVFFKQMNLYREEFRAEIKELKKMNKLLHKTKMKRIAKWSQ